MQFIPLIEQMGTGTRTVKLDKALVNNKEGYILKVNDATWEIEPQVMLDAEQGVSVQCKPDFVIWPVRAEGRKPVVIFTDGFQFHKDRVADDTLKRIAIMRSGNFRVWSFSWRDVQSIFSAQGDYCTDTLNAMKMPSGTTMYQSTVRAAQADSIQPDKMSSFELLIRYLVEPEAENMFTAHARGYALSLLDPAKFRNALSFLSWNDNMSEVIQETHFVDEAFEQGRTLFGKWTPRAENIHLTVYSGIQVEKMKQDQSICVG